MLIKRLLRRTAEAAASQGIALPLARQQGFLDARSTRHVAGWVRDLNNPATRLNVDVMLDGAVLYRTTADRFSQTLVAVGVGDGRFGFHVTFPRELSEAERDRVQVIPAGARAALPHAPQLDLRYQPWIGDRGTYQGYLDERSTHHVAGWVRDTAAEGRRVAIEVVLPGPDGERILHRGMADRFSRQLVDIGIADGVHAFHILLEPPVTEAERDRILVRPQRTDSALELAPALRTQFWPIAHVALDIVNNCNLRCPFCIVDYANTRATKFMTEATFNAALRLLPYVSEANFWLSCLHEATLHPQLLDFINRVPREYRTKLFYTTNLAKRMPASYFAALADSGIHHLNISIESFDPAIYEKMRAGARHRIFQENWDALLKALAAGSAPPRLRYNMMAYRSNLAEIPHIVQTLLDEKRACQVEVRFTYDRAHIPAAFRDEEFLTTAEWAELKAALSHHDPEQVILVLPRDEEGIDSANYQEPTSQTVDEERQFEPATAPWDRAPRPFNISMNWEGTMRVYGWQPGEGREADRFVCYAQANINMLPDPLKFVLAL